MLFLWLKQWRWIIHFDEKKPFPTVKPWFSTNNKNCFLPRFIFAERQPSLITIHEQTGSILVLVLLFVNEYLFTVASGYSFFSREEFSRISLKPFSCHERKPANFLPLGEMKLRGLHKKWGGCQVRIIYILSQHIPCCNPREGFSHWGRIFV